MVKDASAQRFKLTYGPITFVAAVVNTLVVEFAVWIFLPWFVLAIYVLPLLLVDLVIALILRSRVGASGQIGQGMLIGLIAAPAALALFLPGLMLAQASGLI